MRIDNLGNATFNTTDIAPAANNVFGTAILQYGGASMSRTNSTTLDLNRSSSDGAIISFRKDGSSVGSIGTEGSTLTINGHATASGLYFATDYILPRKSGALVDNAIDIGDSAYRFKDIYRSGSTFQTSDRTMKQDIRDLTDAERNVAVACKGLLKAFRFIDAVEKEGVDANIHFGIIAQDLAAAFSAEGLDANDYQAYKLIVTTDEDGNEQTRLNVCYENLLAFIIAAI
jgi:hypothetical protein